MKTIKMQNRICLFVLLCFIIIGNNKAQEKGFLFTYADSGHSWLAKDAIETSMGDFIIGIKDNWGSESRLIKLSADGAILADQPVIAEDTNVKLCRIFHLPGGQDGDYLAVCPCVPDDGSEAAMLFVGFNEALEITSRKAVACPFMEPGDGFFDAKFMTTSFSIIATVTVRPGGAPIGPTFLTQINSECDFVSYRMLDSISTVCSLFLAEDENIGLFCGIGLSYMGIETFDESLQRIRKDSIFHWNEPEGNNGDFCLYFINDIINSQAAMLPDGSYVVSARLNEDLYHANGYPYKYDRSAILANYGNDFHQPENMLVIEHMNDSIEYPAFFRSLDFRETPEGECEVFQCVILNEYPQSGLIQPFPTGLVVTKTDQDLNVEWKKRYLRDGNYQAMSINATEDGGCIVVGSLGDFQEQKLSLFALKINADGMVGIDEIREESLAFVYPNPANGTLNIGGVEAKETQVYNVNGQCVKTFKGNMANIEDLAKGCYVLSIVDTEGKVQTQRLVVEK